MTLNAHIILKLKGNTSRIDLLNRVLRYLDADWPMGDGCPRNGQPKRYEVCDKCGGFVYNRPMFNEADIKAAAHQCGVGLKIKKWILGEQCSSST